jgi:hypothetical protein
VGWRWVESVPLESPFVRCGAVQVEMFECERAHVSYNVAIRFMDALDQIRVENPGVSLAETLAGGWSWRAPGMDSHWVA